MLLAVVVVSVASFLSCVHGDDVKTFLDIAMNATYPQVSDKVQAHSYHEMYGRFLIPHIRDVHGMDRRGYKFMEIGAGCASIEKKKGMQVWDRLFQQRNDSIWVAELKPRCILKMDRAGVVPKRVNMLVGDQGSEVDMARWVNESGGGFDAIVDDGSHKNHHIYKSLQYLWRHALAPGGLYIIEDLQVTRDARDHRDMEGLGTTDPATGKGTPLFMADVIKDYVEQLTVPTSARGEHWNYIIPPGLKGIYCQLEACAFMKCKNGPNELARCT